MAEIYVKGIISEILPLRQGDTDKGHWEVQEYVISPTEGGRPLCFTISGHDRIAKSALQLGQMYVVRLYVECRAYANKETGQQMYYVSLSYGGGYGSPHFDFYNQAMYSLRAPGFGVSMGYSIQPIALQQGQMLYPNPYNLSNGYGQQGGYGGQQPPQGGGYGGYGQQPHQPQGGGGFPPNVGPDGLPF